VAHETDSCTIHDHVGVERFGRSPRADRTRHAVRQRMVRERDGDAPARKQLTHELTHRCIETPADDQLGARRVEVAQRPRRRAVQDCVELVPTPFGHG
jgi:hypothetical protein